VATDQLAGLRDVAGEYGMVNGLLGKPCLAVPGARPPVQDRRQRRLGHPQLVLEQLAEQVVVAVPGTLIVQRDQEEVGALQPVEDPGRVPALGDGVAQWRRQSLQDRRAPQERLDLGRLGMQQLGPQIVDDVPARAGEGRHAGARIRVVLEGERRQLQPGGPALGALVQPDQVGPLQLHTSPVVEERRRLLVGEAQVGGA
jgi:hypothetical protein